MLSMVVAIAENNVIGRDGTLIWHVPKDLKNFKRITMSGTATMIMGRKTFESLGRVLPGRKHIVLTRNKDYQVVDPNVTIIHSYEEIKPYQAAQEEYYVIGGGELFNTLLPHTHRLYITWIGKSWPGDTYFPEIPSDEFALSDEWTDVDEPTGINLDFAIYDRINNGLEEQAWEEELNNSPE
ncbi:MAG: dihydrofolate reductase [Clostridiaceae bacterium]